MEVCIHELHRWEVFGIIHYAEPSIPAFKGQDHFKGVMCHSSAHTGGGQFKGRKVPISLPENSSFSYDVSSRLWSLDAVIAVMSEHVFKNKHTRLEIVSITALRKSRS